MWTQAGFKVECQSNDDAAKVAEQMKAFLKTKELSNDNWEKGICVKGDTVSLLTIPILYGMIGTVCLSKCARA